MYQLYKCRCKKEFILITEYIDDNHFISCPYCGSRKIRREGKYDSLKECMNNHDIYKRINGALRQIG